MRRTAGKALVLVGLIVLGLTEVGLATSTARQSSDAVFADDFAARTFSGSSGTHAWASNWIEGGESDGPGTGEVTVGRIGGCASSYCLIIKTDDSGARTARRTVDIEAFSSARLSVDLERHSGPTGLIRIQVRAQGGSWTTLATYSLQVDDDAPFTVTLDISDFVSPATEIRFRVPAVAEDTDEAKVLIDNVTIKATATAATTTTTTEPPASTTTLPPVTTEPPPPSTTTTTTTPPTTTTMTTAPPSTSTTTHPADTTTTTRSNDPGTTTTTTTTLIIPPTEDPGYATDKVVLISDNHDAVMAVMQPMEAMTESGNVPDAFGTFTFVNAAESLRSTAVYGVGVGALLAGFLLLGFEDVDRRRRRE